MNQHKYQVGQKVIFKIRGYNTYTVKGTIKSVDMDSYDELFYRIEEDGYYGVRLHCIYEDKIVPPKQVSKNTHHFLNGISYLLTGLWFLFITPFIPMLVITNCTIWLLDERRESLWNDMREMFTYIYKNIPPRIKNLLCYTQ